MSTKQPILLSSSWILPGKNTKELSTKQPINSFGDNEKGWCLDELTEIVELKNETGHKVFPVFYGLDPSDLRKQKGRVEEAFAQHEERFKEDKDKIQRWRNALTQVASIKGWHLNDRHETEFIGDIVRKISVKLCQTYPVVSDELIGMSSRMEELHS
ncbi:hypothetical protein V6N12_028252 [Hibiscus sabdariffa]|uniref:TIR domain-containing protein n=1 Tax=Hibiscus sabdariffa TaxID=183260 RepID=A0ABR2F5D3_9ROSI